MPVKRISSANLPKSRKRKRRKPAPRPAPAPLVQEYNLSGGIKLAPVRSVSDWIANAEKELNQHEVTAMTDRIFGSVLAKYGWARNEQGQVEHVGEKS